MKRHSPSPAEAAEILRSGGLALLPTETLLGLCCDPRVESAVERLAALKGRAPTHPFPLLLPGSLALSDLCVVPEAAERLAARFWPGRLTLVLPAQPGVPTGWQGADGTLGVRRSAHPVARAVVDALGSPLVATSANRTGEPPALTVDGVPPEIVADVDAVLSGGPEPAGLGSTVVRVTAEGRWTVLREASIPASELAACLGERA